MSSKTAAIIAALGCAFLGIIAVVGISALAAIIAFNRTSVIGSLPTPVEQAVQVPRPVIQDMPGSLNPLYEQVDPGVVSIQVSTGQAGPTGFVAGSGFILDAQGHIATNHHVVEGSQQVVVTFFNGLEARADVIGNDPDSDLAIIKVESLPAEAHPLTLGDSDAVKVGDRVVAIGNPFGLENTMTSGIVSAVGRLIPSGFTQFSIPKSIQTDAAINPGNSGGPLIDMNGEVIGVNAQIQTGSQTGGNEGVGFAIPSNILSLVAPSLIDKGSYTWPWLGVSGTDVDQSIMEANSLKTQQGAYILTVIPDSPAAEAGLQGATGQKEVGGLQVPTGGDVVVEAGGEKINNFSDLLNKVAFSKPGDKIKLTILRDGKSMDFTVTLQPRPANLPSTVPQPLPGTPFPFFRGTPVPSPTP